MSNNTVNDLKLGNPPLVCVVAKIVFAKINKIKNYVDDLQEELRLNGFLENDHRNAHIIGIKHKSGEGAKVQFREVKQYYYVNQEHSVSVRLEEESISIVFGDYTDFDNSREIFKEVLDAVEKVNIKKLHCREIQLRYINHISLSEVHSPQFWVEDFVLGMPNLDHLQRLGSVSETTYKSTMDGRLAVRCSAMLSGVTLPPDLLPLEVDTKISQHSDKPFLLLENLHAIVLAEAEFSAQDCLEKIENMRTDIHSVFVQTTKQEAREKWKQK